MARRRAAERPSGGGDGIQTLRQAVPSLTLGLGSAVAYAGAGAYAISRAGELAGLVSVIAALGALWLLLALWRGVGELLAWVAATGAVAYAVTLFVNRHAVDSASPLVGAALLLCAELAAWSIDARWRVASESAVLRRRALALGALVLAGLTASAAVVTVSGLDTGRGLAWTTLGAAAAVGAVGVAVALLRREA